MGLTDQDYRSSNGPWEELRRHNDQLQFLSQMAIELAGTADRQQACSRLLHAVSREFNLEIGFQHTCVDAHGRPQDNLTLVTAVGLSPGEEEQLTSLAPGEQIPGVVAATGRPLYVTPTAVSTPSANETDARPLLQLRNVRVCACLPLRDDDRLLGTLTFASRERDALHGEERDLLYALGRHLAQAQQRWQAQEALRHSEERFRAVLENSLDAAYRRELESDSYDYMSPVIEQMTGFSPAEMNGMSTPTVLDRIHPEDRPRVVHCREVALAQGSGTIEYRFRGKAGDYRWLADHFTVVTDDRGRSYLNGVVRDITQRKQVEEALQQLNKTLEEKVQQRTQALREANAGLQAARDLFSTLFHASPIPTAITRVSDGAFIDVNEAHLRYMGLDREALIGRTSHELNLWLAPEQRHHFLEELQTHGRVRDLEVAFPHPSGEMRTALISVERVDIAGEACAIGTLTDITERIRAEAQIHHLATEITRAEERERQRIGQILHDEVQQMLTALQITLYLAEEGARPQTQATLQEAQAAVRDIVQTTRDLSAELTTAALKSENLQEGFAQLVSFMAERYNLPLMVDVDAACRIPDDDLRGLVDRLVRELLFNSVKHADASGVRLTARMHGAEIVITVEDDGRGFDVAGVEARGIAAGSGLVSLRDRLGLFGGRLHIESAAGAGTRAVITVPLDKK